MARIDGSMRSRTYAGSRIRGLKVMGPRVCLSIGSSSIILANVRNVDINEPLRANANLILEHWEAAAEPGSAEFDSDLGFSRCLYSEGPNDFTGFNRPKGGVRK